MDKEIKVLDKGFVTLIDNMGNDQSIIKAARQSVAKEEIGNDLEQELFIRDLMRWGHLTPFEFVTITFKVKAPLFVYRQWHRSRTQSYVEKSARYTQIIPEFYEPEDSVFTKGNPTNDPSITLHNCKNPDSWVDVGYGTEEYDTEEFPWSWKNEFKKEQDLIKWQYDRWIGTGVRKELARINTPVSQYSEMYATANLRNWFHWLELRLNAHAQWEIRQYGNAVFDLIKQIVPYSCQAFQDYVLDSIKFSKQELVALKMFLGNYSEVRQGNRKEECSSFDLPIDSCDFNTDKEKKEFLNKLKTIWSISV